MKSRFRCIGLKFCASFLLGALLTGYLAGCVSSQAHDVIMCRQLSKISSHNVYLFISKEYNPPEQIVKALENNTVYALLNHNYGVKVIKDVRKSGNDGVLVDMEIAGIYQGGISKRIVIQYRIINNATREEMMKQKDTINSKLGYNKITRKIGKRIAIQVGNLFHCFERS